MQNRYQDRLQGWSIVGWTALGLAFALVVTALGWGFSEEGVRVVVRFTARVSVVFFTLAFAASSLQRLFPSAFSSWALRNRRYLGVSFAVSHLLHLDALVALGVAFPTPFLDNLSALTVVGGGLAYVFVLAMTATSFDRSAAWLSRANWRRLHTVGSFYIWAIFAQSYLPRAIADPLFPPSLIASGLVLAALGLRVAARLRGTRRVAGAVST